MDGADVRPGAPAAPRTDGEPGDKTWEEVNARWERNEQLLADIQVSSPGVFAVIQGGEDLERGGSAAGDLATADPKSAAAYLEASLSRLMKTLDDAARDVGGRYSWDALPMPHEQVLADGPPSGMIPSGAARHAADRAGLVRGAADAALTGIGVVAAIVGVFATGGMAALAAVGAAASGTQAALSIGDYNRLAALRAARTGDTSHDLVEAGAVDSAKAQAVLDTIFAFLDTVEAAKALRQLGGAAGVAEKLGTFGELDGRKQATVLGAAMESMGEAKALDAVGAVCGRLAGSPALARAERYSESLTAKLADHLGGRGERDVAAAAAPVREAEALRRADAEARAQAAAAPPAGAAPPAAAPALDIDPADFDNDPLPERRR